VKLFTALSGDVERRVHRGEDLALDEPWLWVRCPCHAEVLLLPTGECGVVLGRELDARASPVRTPAFTLPEQCREAEPEGACSDIAAQVISDDAGPKRLAG
jgi:hypothetical protein